MNKIFKFILEKSECYPKRETNISKLKNEIKAASNYRIPRSEITLPRAQAPVRTTSNSDDIYEMIKALKEIQKTLNSKICKIIKSQEEKSPAQSNNDGKPNKSGDRLKKTRTELQTKTSKLVIDDLGQKKCQKYLSEQNFKGFRSNKCQEKQSETPTLAPYLALRLRSFANNHKKLEQWNAQSTSAEKSLSFDCLNNQPQSRKSLLKCNSLTSGKTIPKPEYCLGVCQTQEKFPKNINEVESSFERNQSSLFIKSFQRKVSQVLSLASAPHKKKESFVIPHWEANINNLKNDIESQYEDSLEENIRKDLERRLNDVLSITRKLEPERQKSSISELENLSMEEKELVCRCPHIHKDNTVTKVYSKSFLSKERSEPGIDEKKKTYADKTTSTEVLNENAKSKEKKGAEAKDGDGKGGEKKIGEKKVGEKKVLDKKVENIRQKSKLMKLKKEVIGQKSQENKDALLWRHGHLIQLLKEYGQSQKDDSPEKLKPPLPALKAEKPRETAFNSRDRETVLTELQILEKLFSRLTDVERTVKRQTGRRKLYSGKSSVSSASEEESYMRKKVLRTAIFGHLNKWLALEGELG